MTQAVPRKMIHPLRPVMCRSKRPRVIVSPRFVEPPENDEGRVVWFHTSRSLVYIVMQQVTVVKLRVLCRVVG